VNRRQAKQAARDLREAAALIERNGWNQAGFFLPIPGLSPARSPLCVIGAVSVATSWRPVPPTGRGYTRYMVAMKAFGRYLDNCVAGWNDHPARRSWEVVFALRTCADLLEGEQA
jgi:hypothetical protein